MNQKPTDAIRFEKEYYCPYCERTKARKKYWMNSIYADNDLVGFSCYECGSVYDKDYSVDEKCQLLRILAKRRDPNFAHQKIIKKPINLESLKQIKLHTETFLLELLKQNSSTQPNSTPGTRTTGPYQGGEKP